MDIIVGIPAKKNTDSIFWTGIIDLLSYEPVLIKISVQNDVAIGRNILYGDARKYKKPLIMIDTDVLVNPQNLYKYIEEDFANGYDLVVAPLLSHAGYPLFTPFDIQDLRKTEPYEIEASGFGFVALSKKLIEELPPISPEDTRTLEGTYATFFTKTPTSTEDYVFCNYIRSKGYKICLDPRIQAKHLTLVPYVFSPEQMGQLLDERNKENKA